MYSYNTPFSRLFGLLITFALYKSLNRGDLTKRKKSALHHYPFAYNPWRSSTPSSLSSNEIQSNNIGNTNYVQPNGFGTPSVPKKQSSNLGQQQDFNRKSQSAYAKVKFDCDCVNTDFVLQQFFTKK